MNKALIGQALTNLLLCKISHCALISSYYDYDASRASLVKIENGTFDTAVELEITVVSYGVTLDPTSGILYSLDENINFNTGTLFMELNIISDDQKTSIPIKPSEIVLDCLTSGPAGIMSFATDGKIGTIDANTGQWNEILSDPLPPPYTNYVLAQDCDGTLHYINGDGAYYTLKQNTRQLERVIGVTFPTGNEAFCGDFTSDNIITAIKFNAPVSEESIIQYDIEKVIVTTERITPAANFLDVTTGDPSDVCDFNDAVITEMPSMSPSMYPSISSSKGKKSKKGMSSKMSNKGSKKSMEISYFFNYTQFNESIFESYNSTADIVSNLTNFNTSYFSSKMQNNTYSKSEDEVYPFHETHNHKDAYSNKKDQGDLVNETETHNFVNDTHNQKNGELHLVSNLTAVYVPDGVFYEKVNSTYVANNSSLNYYSMNKSQDEEIDSAVNKNGELHSVSNLTSFYVSDSVFYEKVNSTYVANNSSLNFYAMNKSQDEDEIDSVVDSFYNSTTLYSNISKINFYENKNSDKSKVTAIGMYGSVDTAVSYSNDTLYNTTATKHIKNDMNTSLYYYHMNDTVYAVNASNATVYRGVDSMLYGKPIISYVQIKNDTSISNNETLVFYDDVIASYSNATKESYDNVNDIILNNDTTLFTHDLTNTTIHYESTRKKSENGNKKIKNKRHALRAFNFTSFNSTS